MPRKKTLTPEEEEERATFFVITLKGGPRDGSTMRVAKQLQEELRFGFPEWCVYRQTDARTYTYVSLES